MLDMTTSERWHEVFSGGNVGVLLLEGIDNSERVPPLDTHKRELEKRLRQRFADYTRKDYLELDVLEAYHNYYRRFGNTYHVQAQLESVVKGKALPSVSPLVDANFVAELETFVLTAGHDADLLQPPLSIDATRGAETFVQLNGREKQLKANDMMMRDASGIVCTILYGQDKRTPISPKTTRALYVAYAPAGVPKTAVVAQLEAIRANVEVFSPEARVGLLEIFTAEERRV